MLYRTAPTADETAGTSRVLQQKTRWDTRSDSLTEVVDLNERDS